MAVLLRTLFGCLFATVIALLGASSASAAQRADKHTEHGFSVDVPSSFEARPVPADRPGLVAVYAPKKAPKDRRSPVTHSVWKVDLGAAGKAASELVVRRWILDTLSPTKMEPVRSVRSRYGRDPLRFEGATMGPDGSEWSLFVHGWVGEKDVILFVGECEKSLLRRERRAFDRTADSFRFFTQAETDKARRKWTRHYQRSSLPHREKRIDIATATVAGWSIRDTKHSIILFHGPSNSPVLDQVARNLVAVRRQFAEDFVPDRPIDGLSVVRICRDRGEYLTYGGNPNTVGYFHPRAQELVIYDARTDVSESMPNDHPTLRTLYHEASHQFLHHTASSMSPHSWFDEGTGEFYAGAVIASGSVGSIIGLADRDEYIRQPEVQRRLPRLEALLAMTQDEFYADADVNYSMGYAFIRFLRTSEAAAVRHKWKTLLTRYFETLRSTWRREAENLALQGLSGDGYRRAVETARAVALEAALKGIKMEDLETEFLQWVSAGGRD